MNKLYYIKHTNNRYDPSARSSQQRSYHQRSHHRMDIDSDDDEDPRRGGGQQGVQCQTQ